MKVDSALVVSGLIGLASAQKFVKLPFDKSIGTKSGPLQKRDDVTGDGYTNIQMGHEKAFYSVKLNIGTPSQEVTVVVDTGSSDFWIMGADNSLCNDVYGRNLAKLSSIGGQNKAISDTIGRHSEVDGDSSTATPTSTMDIGGYGDIATEIGPEVYPTVDCSKYGTFNKLLSSSFKSNDTSFAISYGDRSYASGTWGTDILHIGSVNVSDLSMAVANFTNSSIGILGIGLPGLETTYVNGTTIHGAKGYEYSNFPMVLKDNGIIESSSYSLYLDDPGASNGSVLFGAVDHSKYVDGLYTVPLVNIYEEMNITKPVEFDVTLFGMGIMKKKKKTTIAETRIPALLDSGTTISYFPSELLKMIASQLDATLEPTTGFYLMQCDQKAKTNLVFDFGGFHITAPLRSFQAEVYGDECLLKMSTHGERIILGDVFLQHAYVVYDLENLEISMGQANYDSSSDPENVELIKSTVPSAVPAGMYSSTWNGTNLINTNGNIFTKMAAATVTGSGSATATDKSTEKTGDKTTADHSTDSNVNKKQNAANISYSVHSMITYVMVLFASWFF